MSFTTRTKITALFASIVSILIVLLNALIFQSANNEWQSKKAKYMHESMTSMLTVEEAKKKFPDLQVTSSSGAIIYQQGIFTHNMVHRSIGSWIFKDPSITIADGRAYYWGIESKVDGLTYKTVDDVTDIIFTRDMIINRSVGISLIGFLLLILIGNFFSWYILRPIQNMNEATRRFSLSEKSGSQMVGIYGNIKDEVVILARSLEELFNRVNKEAERLEQFSDDIAHEIKNNLFEVMTYLNIAENAIHPGESIKKGKAKIRSLSNVVDALLFFARNEIGAAEVKDVGLLLHSYLGNEDSRVQIVETSELLIPIYPELFLTAIGNIVSNAEKFTPPDGTITIRISHEGIQITDTWIAIAKKHLPHIFDRLYKVDTARTNGTGHGLGLSISKKILEELHKMKLSVESEPGVGTTFFIHTVEV